MDITPNQFEIIPVTEKIILPSDPTEMLGSTYGGWLAESGALANGKVRIEATNERILLGSATAPLTGTGVFIGNDGATVAGYDFRAGNPAGNYIHWDESAGTLTIVGSLTATSGTIGGFSIGTDYIRDVANSFGLASTVTGGDDVRFWAGDTFANRATAPFRITEAGAVTASSITITGGSITATPISAIPNSTATDISLLEYTHNLTFSVTDADTIAWSSGTITLSNGRTFSISAGNTGNMSALTYIYLDPGVSSTVLQTTTTYSTAMGANKKLIGSAQNNTVTASYIPYGPGQPLIDGANIGALSIIAGNIAAGSITSTKISVSQLSAITADMGALTAGTIVLPSGGYIRSGQTAYRTGTGWYIGNDSSTPKASFGTGTTGPEMYWDGTDLIATNIKILRSFTAGEELFAGDVVYPTGNNTVERVRPTSFASNSATFTETATAGTHKTLKIDATRSLHVSGGYRAATLSLRAAIGTVNTNETDMTYGSEYNFGSISSNYFDVCQFDTYKFLVIFYQSTTPIKTVVLDVSSSGTTITAGTIVEIESTGNDSIQLACAKLDTGRVAIVYAKNSDTKYYVQVLSISGTTITTNTAVLLGSSTNSGKSCSLAYLTTDKLLCVYADDSSDPLVAKTIDVSGTTPTVNGSNTIKADSLQYGIGTMAVISATKVVIPYSYNDGAETWLVAVLTISGSTVTVGTPLTLHSTAAFVDGYSNILALSSSVLLTATRKTNTGIKYHLLSLDGTTLTSTTTVEFSVSSNSYPSSWLCKMKPFKYLGIAGTEYSFVTLNSNSNIFIGVTNAAIADTASGLIALKGFPNTALSGLTAGTIYYIDDSGLATTESSSLSVRLGVAFNTTSIPIET